MRAAISPTTRINLENSVVLLVDDSKMSLDILNSAFMGFGVRERLRVENADDAKRILQSRPVDLLVLEGGLPDETAYALMHWLRHEAAAPVCYTPVVIIVGHATRASVMYARDAGANFVIAKPISAGTLFSRVVWIAREQRAFLKGDSYAGPDRRFHNLGIPRGMEGRRDEDVGVELGAATDPNLSQSEVDTIMKPMKVDL